MHIFNNNLHDNAIKTKTATIVFDPLQVKAINEKKKNEKKLETNDGCK